MIVSGVAVYLLLWANIALIFNLIDRLIDPFIILYVRFTVIGIMFAISIIFLTLSSIFLHKFLKKYTEEQEET